MPRYIVKPHRRTRAAYDSDWSNGETSGTEVYDDGSWSEDQPTGLLTASGDMIYRCANRIGFALDDE